MLDKFKAELCKVLEIDSIDDDFDFKDVDSLMRAEIILLTEEHIGKMLTNEQILEMKTFKDLKAILLDD